MDKYGVKSTHEAIKKKLMDYISTVYLGKNDALRAACMNELGENGVLFQEPYIEANHAYLSVRNGIAEANLPADVKRILKEMLVVLYPEEVIIRLISRLVVQLIEHPALGLCYVKLSSERLPAGYMGRNDIEIITAEHQANNGLIRAFALV